MLFRSDDPDLQADLTSVRRKPNLTNDTVLESKDDMKSRGARSPDLGDALCLTFASLDFIPTAPNTVATTHFGLIDGPQSVTTTPDPFAVGGGGGWMG